MSAPRWSPEEALLHRVVREELAPICEEQIAIRDDLAAIVDLLSGQTLDDRRVLKQWVDTKKLIAWLDSEVGRTSVNTVLGNRSTTSRWAKGESKKTRRNWTENLLCNLGLAPAELPDEVLIDDDPEVAA